MERRGTAMRARWKREHLLPARPSEYSLFEFDYQIECYVKAELRQFGYFCLPILYRDRFVGRMDCKAHRHDQHLEIKQLFIERPVDEGFVGALTDAVWSFADSNNCVDVSLTSCKPGRLAAPIATSLQAH